MTALHHRSGTTLPHHRLQRGRWWMRVPVAGCGSGASVSSAAPPPIENFPCMRAGAVPLSSRGTHSAFSQKQSVTSEPSSSLHNLSRSRSIFDSIRVPRAARDTTRRARILRPVARVAAKLVHRIRPRVSISRCFSPRESDQRLRIPAIPAIPAVRFSPIIARNVSPFCFMLSESQ